MNLVLYFIFGGAVLLLAVYLLLRQQRYLRQPGRRTSPSVPVNLASVADAVLVASGYGRIVFANERARQWFGVNGGDPNLELMSEVVDPPDMFRELFAAEGWATFQVGMRRVEASSHLLPEQDERRMVVVMRELTADRADVAPDLARAASLLQDIGQVISHNPPLDRLLDQVLARLWDAVTCDAIQVRLFDADSKTIYQTARQGDDVYVQQLDHVAEAQGDRTYGVWVMAYRQPLLVEDTAHSSRGLPSYGQSPPFRSYLGVPLLVDDRPVGLLEMVNQDVQAFDHRDLALLEAVADPLAVAVDRAWWFARQHTQALHLTGVQEISRAVESVEDSHLFFGQLTSRLAQLMNVEMCGILLYWPSRGHLLSQTPFYGIPDAIIERYYSLVDEARLLRRVQDEGGFFVNNLAEHTDLMQYSRLGKLEEMIGVSLRNLILVPMFAGERYIGAVQVMNKRGNEAFSAADLAQLRAFAGQAGLIVEGAQFYRQQQQRSDDIRLLQESSQLLSRTAYHAAWQQDINARLKALLNVELCGVMEYDARRRALIALPPFEGADGEMLAYLQLSLPNNNGLEAAWQAQDYWLSNDLIGDAVASQIGLDDVASYVGFKQVLLVPLRVAGRLTGALLAANKTGNDEFTPGDASLLGVVAAQVAIFLENLRLYAEAETRLNQMESLRRISDTAHSRAPLEEVIPAILQETAAFFDSELVLVDLLDEDSGELRTRPEYVFGRELGMAVVIDAYSPDFQHSVILSRQPFLSNDIFNEKRALVPYRTVAEQLKFKQMMAYPLVVGDVGVGEIIVASPRGRDYGEADLHMLADVAAELSVAIDRVRLAQATDQNLQARVNELDALNRVSNEINVTIELPRVMEVIRQEALRITRAAECTILLLSAHHEWWLLEEPEMMQRYGANSVLPLTAPIEERVINSEQAVLVTGYPQSDLMATPEVAVSALAVPVQFNQEVVGVIHLYDTAPQAFEERTERFVAALALKASTAYANARRYREELARNRALSQRVNQLNQIFELSQVLRTENRLEDILDAVAHSVQMSVRFSVVLISLLTEDGRGFRRTAQAGIPLSEFREIQKIIVPRERIEALMQEQFRVSQSYMLPAEYEHVWNPSGALDPYTRVSDRYEYEEQDQSWHENDALVVPLRNSAGQLIGLLSVDGPVDKRRPDQTTVETLEIFAHQAAISIENFRLIEAIQHEAESARHERDQLERLYLLSNEVQKAVDVPTRLQVVARAIQDAGWRKVHITMRDETLDPTALIYVGYDDAEADVLQANLLTGQTWRSYISDPDFYRLRMGTAYYLRYDDSWVMTHIHHSDMTSTTPLPVRRDQWHPLDTLYLPIYGADSRLLGLIGLADPADGKAPTETTLRPIELFANQAANIIETTRLYLETRRAADQESLLNEVMRTLTGTLEISAIIEAVANGLQQIMPFTRMSVALYNAARLHFDVLDVTFASVNRIQLAQGEPQPVRGTAMGSAFRQQMAAIYIGDEETEHTDLLAWRAQEERTTLIVPLVAGGDSIGALRLGSELSRAFGFDENVSLVQRVANLAAVAIRSAQNFQQTLERERFSAALVRLNSALNASLDLNTTLESICRESLDILTVTGAYIWQYVADYDELVGIAGVGPGVELFLGLRASAHDDSFMAARVFAQQKTLYDNGLKEKDALLDILASAFAEPVQAVMGVPLLREGQVVGVLKLVEIDPRHPFTERDVEEAAIFATQATLALENSRLYQETRDLQQFTTAIVESIQQGIIVLNRAGEIRTFNEFMHIEYGWDDTAIGQSLFAYRPYYESVLGEGLEHVLQTGTPWMDYSVPVRLSAEREVFEDLYLYPLKEEDEVTGVVWQFRDVTHQTMLENDLEVRAFQLTALTEVSSKLTATLDIGEVLALVLGELERVLPYNGVTIWLREGDSLRIVAAQGYEAEGGDSASLIGLEVAIEDSELFQEIAERQQVVNVLDVRHDPRFPGAEERPTRSWLGVPLIAKGHIIGLMALDKLEPGYYLANHEQIALNFANQAAVALENARLFETLRRQTQTLARQADRMTLLNRVSVNLAQTLDILDIFEVALQESAQALGVNAGQAVVFELDQQLGVVVVDYPRGDSPPNTTFDLRENPAVALIRRSVKPLVVEDAQNDPVAVAFHRSMIERSVQSAVMAPLNVGGQVIGLLILEAGEAGHEFLSEQLELIQTIASQAGIAVQNANLFEQSVVRTRELETLFEAAQATSMITDFSELLQRIAEQMIHALDADDCTIMMWDEVRDHLIVEVDINRSDDPAKSVLPGTIYPLHEYAARRKVLKDGKGIIVYQDDASSDPAEQADMAAQGIAGRMLVPLTLREQVIGLIKVELNDAFSVFGLSEQRIARTLAGQAAIAIENTRLNNEMSRRIEELFTINELSQAMAAVNDLEDLYPIVRSQVPALTRSEWVYLVLYDAQNKMLHFPVVVHRGQSAALESRPLGNDEFSQVLRSRQMLLLVGDGLTMFRRNRQVETILPDVQSLLIGPLMVGYDVVGVLAIADDNNPYAYTLNDQRILSTIGGQLATTIQNASLIDQLEARVRVRTEELRHERDRLNTLYTVTAELSAMLELDRMLRRALELLSNAVGAVQGLIMLVEPRHDMLRVRAEFGFEPSFAGPDERFFMNEGLYGWVSQNRQSVIVPDVQADPRWLHLRPTTPEPRAALAVLLESSDDVQGVMMLFGSEPGIFDDAHLRLVSTAAQQLASAINNAELYNYIREQAESLGKMAHDQQIEASKSGAILDSVADGVMVANERGEIIVFNDAAERILEIDRNRIMGRPISNLSGLYGGGGRRWMQAIEEWMGDPAQIMMGEYLSETLDLGERVISVSLAPVNMGDQFLGTVSVFRDITREVEADRVKTEFISNVSHELRTPMTSIKGYADLLAMGAAGPVNDRQREFVETIKSNADRLSMLVNDLLTISRLDDDRTQLNYQQVSLAELARSVERHVNGRSKNEKKAMTVVLEMDDDLPLTYADNDRLTQVITNLADNAFQYTPVGGKITVTVRRPEDGNFRLSVSDTGVGIPRKLQSRIFERFFRNDEQQLVMETPGTGLGLAIVKELVERHGGTIGFESEEGKGTTFTITLPWHTEPPLAYYETDHE